METRIALSSPGAPVEMAREGTFRAFRGGKVTLTRQMLAEIAANTKDPVPLKLGHEERKTSDPNLGHVTNLRVENGVLLGDPVPTEYGKEKNRSGAYRHCSPELEKGSSGWKMTALGLLGAWPPADTGKRAVSLAAPSDGERVIVLSREQDARRSPRVPEEAVQTAMRGFKIMNPLASDQEARDGVLLSLEQDADRDTNALRVALADAEESESMTQKTRAIMAANPGMTFFDAANRLFGMPR